MRQLGKEELESKLQYFAEAFEFKTGKRLDLNMVQAYLEDEKHRIELQLIKEAFNNMSHESIRLLINLIMQKMNEKKSNIKKTNSYK